MSMQGTLQNTFASTGLLITRSLVGVVGIYHGGKRLFWFFCGVGAVAMGAATASVLAWKRGVGQFVSTGTATGV